MEIGANMTVSQPHALLCASQSPAHSVQAAEPDWLKPQHPTEARGTKTAQMTAFSSSETFSMSLTSVFRAGKKRNHKPPVVICKTSSFTSVDTDVDGCPLIVQGHAASWQYSWAGILGSLSRPSMCPHPTTFNKSTLPFGF